MECKLLAKKLRANAVLPQKGTDGAACSDIFACIDEKVEIAPGKTEMIPTGISISVPKGFGAFIFARSGLGIKRGIVPSNCVGVIDSDYRGEVCVGLYNHSDTAYTVTPGDRIAQMAVIPVVTSEWEEANELSETERGSGGFGSTGK